MRAWARRGAWVVGLWALCQGGAAWAGAGFEVAETTTVQIPEGANPGARFLIDEAGAVFMTTVGAEGTWVLPVTLGEGADGAWSYQHEGLRVEPVSFAFGPGGDLLLRGNATPETNDPPFGVTARVTRAGEPVWETSDLLFAGDSEFLGTYAEAVGPVVWSPLAQRAMVFSTSSFEVAPVSQASMLFELNGQVRDASVTFGDQYIGATLNNALRTPSGKFLVYYFSQNDRGTRFYLYNGVSTIEAFRPEGGDWTKRAVYFVRYDFAGNLILIWNDLADDADPVLGVTRTKMTKLDPDGKLLWETDLSGSISVDVIDPVLMMPATEQVDLLRPVFVVVGAQEVVLLRQAGQGFFFDVRSSSDGAPKGFIDFFSLTEDGVYDFAYLNGSQGRYLLSTVNEDDPTVNQVLAVDLVLNDTPVAIGPNVNNGPAPNNSGAANNGGGPLVDPDADPETPDIPTASEAICGCGSLAAPARGWPWALAGVLGLFLARRGLG